MPLQKVEIAASIPLSVSVQEPLQVISPEKESARVVDFGRIDSATTSPVYESSEIYLGDNKNLQVCAAIYEFNCPNQAPLQFEVRTITEQNGVKYEYPAAFGEIMFAGSGRITFACGLDCQDYEKIGIVNSISRHAFLGKSVKFYIFAAGINRFIGDVAAVLK